MTEQTCVCSAQQQMTEQTVVEPEAAANNTSACADDVSGYILQSDKCKPRALALSCYSGEEWSELPGSCITCSENFVAYVVRGSAIRVLHHVYVHRCIFPSSHSGPVTDISFFEGPGDRLGTTGKDGMVCVREIAVEDKVIVQRFLLRVCGVAPIPAPGFPASDQVPPVAWNFCRFAWNTTAENFAAATADGHIAVVDMHAAAQQGYNGDKQLDLTPACPAGTYFAHGFPSVVDVSLLGRRVAVSCVDGSVVVWDYAADRVTHQWHPHPTCPPSQQRILFCKNGTVVTFGKGEVKLWRLLDVAYSGTSTPASASDLASDRKCDEKCAECIQTVYALQAWPADVSQPAPRPPKSSLIPLDTPHVTHVAEAAADVTFHHPCFDPTGMFICAAVHPDSKSILVMHVNNEGKIDHSVEFTAEHPTLALTATNKMTLVTVAKSKKLVLNVYCYGTRAVQQYFAGSSVFFPSDEPTAAAAAPHMPPAPTVATDLLPHPPAAPAEASVPAAVASDIAAHAAEIAVRDLQGRQPVTSRPPAHATSPPPVEIPAELLNLKPREEAPALVVAAAAATASARADTQPEAAPEAATATATAVAAAPSTASAPPTAVIEVAHPVPVQAVPLQQSAQAPPTTATPPPVVTSPSPPPSATSPKLPQQKQQQAKQPSPSPQGAGKRHRNKKKDQQGPAEPVQFTIMSRTAPATTAVPPPSSSPTPPLPATQQQGATPAAGTVAAPPVAAPAPLPLMPVAVTPSQAEDAGGDDRVLRELHRIERDLSAKFERELASRFDKLMQQHERYQTHVQQEKGEQERTSREAFQRLAAMVTQLQHTQEQRIQLMQQGMLDSVQDIRRDLLRVIQDSITGLPQAFGSQLETSLVSPLRERVAVALKEALTPRVEGAVSDSTRAAFATSMPDMANIRTAVEGALQTGAQATFQQCFKEVLIPGYERATQVLLRQIAQSFDAGLMDAMKQHQEFLRALQQANRDAASASEADALAQLRQAVRAVADMCGAVASSAAETQQRVLASTAETHRLLIDMAASGAGAGAASVSARPQARSTVDPYIEVQRLLDSDLGQALSFALSQSDLNLLVFLCKKIDPATAVEQNLPQCTLLSLVQQLASDLGTDTLLKISWLREATACLNGNEPLVQVILPHLVAQLGALYPTLTPGPAHICRTIMHVANSILACAKLPGSESQLLQSPTTPITMQPQPQPQLATPYSLPSPYLHPAATAPVPQQQQQPQPQPQPQQPQPQQQLLYPVLQQIMAQTSAAQYKLPL
eukprot:TRINITY_DN1497_c0_g1_i1.p1 TRINITY_DN1497_c0_g1~~TRINITY_DN1497_c0_g1_i1.p1  ORF type:complete len:1269 (-),score=346.20 TRINITY_DN1497_c0_g1_i1:83-3889(-)